MVLSYHRNYSYQFQGIVNFSFRRKKMLEFPLVLRCPHSLHLDHLSISFISDLQFLSGMVRCKVNWDSIQYVWPIPVIDRLLFTLISRAICFRLGEHFHKFSLMSGVVTWQFYSVVQNTIVPSVECPTDSCDTIDCSQGSLTGWPILNCY